MVRTLYLFTLKSIRTCAETSLSSKKGITNFQRCARGDSHGPWPKDSQDVLIEDSQDVLIFNLLIEKNENNDVFTKDSYQSIVTVNTGTPV